jgi:hypothetical protein
MRLFLRGSIASVLLLVLAGCGVTGDELEAGSTTTSSTTTSTTAPDESSTTTEPDSTTTTAGSTGTDDPELEALLLTEEDFETAVELDVDADNGFEQELCSGQSFTVAPVAQASTGFLTAGEGTVAAQAIAEFNFEDDASLFLEELQSLNQLCKDADDEDAIPATFEPVPDLGDEAIRAIADPGVEGLELIAVRADERVILLLSYGPEQLLTNPVIIAAVDRASP